ncbi:ABC-2 type transport system ATP-binding protein [Nocardioides luteus]|uniref:ABC transporter ATP-binding protein n=1 Tax=Nocardioides luteus TaxID=1844 RepID=A0ABQ5SVJ7_9ACTN|nr:ABC transporter ATP-binding protein [Nocardioides luteus]MDR7311974.1 ABC-2 type transport system ATP-binding protein [Nocardioides luteus]GGR68352.1 ABC transporter ATP-binding protein [Nocardioides luteus]GLJ68218.1 ABC transporter ATP-binding protein [Nocardioides luteus]
MTLRQAQGGASDSIVVDGVTKNFTLRYHRSIKDITVAKMKGRAVSNTFKALDDVTFTIKQGESVGLMGLNGSGKSTLLKLISGVMRPDEGTVKTRGQIAGLIATGAGFHPQLSGRENIFLNAAIYGLSAEETAAIYDDVVRFAELGDHLNSPVGNYSSGQYSRLGFSVAVHIDSDIFLADEVLAVGDKPFKKKCMEKMEEIRDSGRTVVYVSHAAGSVKRMCDRVICLEKGRLVFDGDVDEGIEFLHYGEDDGKGSAAQKRLDAADSALGAEV